MEQQEDIQVILHLKQALSHMEQAIRDSIQTIEGNPSSQKEIGYIWEEFLGTFFGKVRTIGKDHKINLLNLVSFERLKKF